jgi:hypothetical protein
MNGVEFLALALVALSILSALGLIHLQNQVNRLRKSQALMSQSLSVALTSMVAYVDILDKENK